MEYKGTMEFKGNPDYSSVSAVENNVKQVMVFDLGVMAESFPKSFLDLTLPAPEGIYVIGSLKFLILKHEFSDWLTLEEHKEFFRTGVNPGKKKTFNDFLKDGRPFYNVKTGEKITINTKVLRDSCTVKWSATWLLVLFIYRYLKKNVHPLATVYTTNFLDTRSEISTFIDTDQLPGVEELGLEGAYEKYLDDHRKELPFERIEKQLDQLFCSEDARWHNYRISNRDGTLYVEKTADFRVVQYYKAWFDAIEKENEHK